MCGFAGLFAHRAAPPPSLDALRSMIAMLGHRGPDGYGLYRDTRVGLAAARLSIIDLEGGFQPLTNEDGSVWLAYNGEIFNYLELRRELRAKGHRFATDGDSEVIVHLYEEYGENAWSRLNGQFAFAIWDRRARKLALVRDRLGIVPLFYARGANGLAFGSEAKALFASGVVEPRIDPLALTETFTRWSVSAPVTPFTGVTSVRPGAAVYFDDELHEREQRYWQLDFLEDPEFDGCTIDDIADLLGEHLERAVNLRLRADVPVGAYLSGGLDSSIIASLVKAADRSSLQTFAVRFEDPAYDETDAQHRVAGVLGTQHHELLCDAATIRDSLAAVVWHTETPLLRTAPVPLYLLSGLVRDAGMKVVLTGEGADELLAGYGIFKEDKIRRFWARDPDSSSRPRLLERLHPEVSAGGARGSQLWRQFFGRHLTETDDPFYSHRLRWENTAWTHALLAPDVRAAAASASLEADLTEELPVGWSSWSALSRAQWIEIRTFLSSYLLTSQGDRVAMANGVEVRYPYLDPQFVDLCLRLPSALKMPGLRDKIALRRLAARLLPDDVAQRPKLPYRAPNTAPFVVGGESPVLDDLLSEADCARYGLIDPRAASALAAKARGRGGAPLGEREEMALVGAVTLQMLARAFGDEFQPRAARLRDQLDRTQPHVFEDHLEVGV